MTKEVAETPSNGTYQALFSKVLNGLLFYVIWFVCAGSVAQDLEYLGLLSIAVFLVFHFALSKNRMKEALTLTFVILLGFCFDSVYLLTGTLTYYTPNPWVSWGAPLWILAMYALFSTTFDYSLSWTKKLPWWLQALLGAGGGVATYVAGEKMHIVEFLLPGLSTVIVIACAWALLFPFSCWVHDRLSLYFPEENQ